jgi:glycosyltransferase involved in cell wall biosynthesis
MSTSVLFLCPFWGQSGHVGTFRAERLVRWLHQAGHRVVVVSAGHSDNVVETDFGQLITVRDPLKIYPDPQQLVTQSISERKPNRLRRWLCYFLLVPDLHVVWARAVLKSTLVNQVAEHARVFIASSPPESTFIAASRLADRYHGRFFMDMRDGWLDEPMKPLLRSMWLQKFREARIERNLLGKADNVTVTSTHWKELLVKRHPHIAEKIVVIPNTFPQIDDWGLGLARNDEMDPGVPETFTLVHAGRLSSSRPERNADFLLNEIIHHIEQQKVRIRLNFIGNLEPQERSCLNFWSNKFEQIGAWLHHTGQVSRFEALQIMSKADGLLMISNSYASIPAKYFDYTITGKPILCFTTKDSIMVDISRKQPQIHVVLEGQYEENDPVITAFLDSVRARKHFEKCENVTEFSETTVKKDFLNLIVQ